MLRKIAGASIAAAASLALAVGPAFAADSWVSANLKPVAGNGVQGSGTAQVTISGTEVKVEMAATGLLPDQPHAAHIHYGEAARHECPTLGDDTNDDHHLNTTEGGPAYGDIVVSLTKTGDTSPKSGLAVDRFDTAPGGKISYERGSINVTSAVAEDIASAGYCFQVDLARRAVRAGAVVAEVPITFVERERGESKMSGGIVVEALVRVTGWGLQRLFRLGSP